MSKKSAAVRVKKADMVPTDPGRPDWAKGLDDREYRYVGEYLKGFNSTRAALAAGFAPSSAYQRAYEMKHRPMVRAAINAALREAMPALKVTLAERLAAIVTTDIGEIVDWKRSGRRGLAVDMRPLAELNNTQRASIKAIRKRVGPYGDSLDIVMHDPIAAAERLTALLEMTRDTGAGGGGQVVFVIETPEGHVIRDVTAAPVIDHDAVTAGIAANREPEPDELPPGARIVIETP